MTRLYSQVKKVRLDQLCILVTDGTHDSPKLQPRGVPFIKGKHISKGFIDFENCDYITREEHQRAIKRSKPEQGDILFSNIGSVGDCAFISTDREFSIKNVALFKANPDVVDCRYLYYVVISPKFKNELHAKRSGVAQPFFSLEMLRSHEVNYHSDRLTQKKIASVLSAYDDLIENNLRRIKILEEMAQNLYREWFVKFRFPGHENIKFVDSPIGNIPEEWNQKNLLDVAEVTYGFAFKSKGFNTEGRGKPVVRIRDVISGESTTFSEEIPKGKHLVKNGDILVGMDGDFHQGIWAGGDAWLVQRVARFRPIENMKRFLLHLAIQKPIRNFNETITGTTVAHLGHTHIKTINLLLPPEDTLQYYGKVFEPILNLILNLRFKNRSLRQARDLLLPRLISGELDISDLDIEIPEETA